MAEPSVFIGEKHMIDRNSDGLLAGCPSFSFVAEHFAYVE